MALFKSLLPRKQPNYILSAFRLCSSPTWHRFLMSSSYAGNKTGKKFEYSPIVNTITNQVRGCIKGALTQEAILSTYWSYKSIEGVSGGDNVRILYRLASLRRVKLRCDDNVIGDLYKVLIKDIMDKKTQLKPFQIADVFFSLGKLGCADSEVFNQFGSLIEKANANELSGFSNVDIAMILWAHGKANITSDVLFTALEGEILKRGLVKFNGKDINQIVWSFAKVGKRSPVLFEEAAKEIEKMDTTKLSNLDIKMLLWAFSKKGNNVESLFNHIKMELLNSSRLSWALCSDLSVILWSFANQGIIAPDLFSRIEKEIVLRQDSALNEQTLVFIAWSFARTNNNSHAIFKLVEHVMMSASLKEWSLKSLVQILWAFTKSGLSSSFVLEAVTSAFAENDLRDLPQDSLDEMAFILQNCKLNLSPELVSSIETEIKRRVENTNSEHNN